jgi:Holliday junction resolvase RusA-like endonuclease
MAQLITLTLPFPPSINGAYRNVPKIGRVKTKAYKVWEVEASISAKMQAGTAKVDGPYAFHMRADRPDRRRRDLSNLIKVTEDLVVRLGFVEDDSYCQRIKVSWSDAPPRADAQVTVWLISTKDGIGDE